jgi:hypothetical protein
MDLNGQKYSFKVPNLEGLSHETKTTTLDLNTKDTTTHFENLG